MELKESSETDKRSASALPLVRGACIWQLESRRFYSYVPSTQPFGTDTVQHAGATKLGQIHPIPCILVPMGTLLREALTL